MLQNRPAAASLARIRTLGPAGTNCEAAARHYLASLGLEPAGVHLHGTLEEALDLVLEEPDSALLGCVVYPDLHKLVFPHLGRMELRDVFLFDTYDMVLASRGASVPRTVASHPAPRSLCPEDAEVTLVDSNAEAARLCAAGRFEGCITTRKAADAQGLVVLVNHGPVPMGFTIHMHRGA